MRYTDTETVNLVGRLPTGETVTIEVYEIDSGNAVAVSTNVCTEIATSGLFKWSKSNMTTQPTVYTEYVYTMIDGLNNRYDGKFVISPAKIDEVHQILGLNTANPMTVTPTSRTVGSIVQNITGDGVTTSTVTRI